MRARNFVIVVAAVVGAVVLVRRRTGEYVEVEFDDGSSVRLESAAEARDLLEDAAAIVEIAS
jgi:hypothetical protein